MRNIVLSMFSIILCLITPRLNAQVVELNVSKDRFASVRNLINSVDISNSSLSNFVDSLLLNDNDQLRILVDYAYPIRFDSIYDNRIYQLELRLRNTEDANVQGEIAQELIDYQYDALIPFVKEIDGSLSYKFWRSFILTSVLGYDLAFYLEPMSRGISGLFLSSTKLNLNKAINHKENLKNILFEWVESNGDAGKHQELFKNIALEELQKGALSQHYEYFVSRLVSKNIQTKDELFLADYSTLIENSDSKARLWLLKIFGEESGSEYYPEIMMNVLKKGPPKEIIEVLRWTSNCWDQSKREEVHDAVLSLFYNSTDEVKFQSCFVLMHDFQDPIAIDYLLNIVKRGPETKKINAIGWVGDACNSGQEMPDTTYNTLVPLLNHDDIRFRRATIEAFTTYVGERVVESLIPFLNFELKFIAERVERKLLNYHDKQLVVAKLEEYDNDENAELNSIIKRLIVKLESK